MLMVFVLGVIAGVALGVCCVLAAWGRQRDADWEASRGWWGVLERQKCVAELMAESGRLDAVAEKETFASRLWCEAGDRADCFRMAARLLENGTREPLASQDAASGIKL